MFTLATSPHTHSSNSTQKHMLWVILALLPAMFCMITFFGYGVVIQSIIAIAFALVLELIVTLLRKKSITFYINDLSVILTALILAMAIPPYAPYWIILIGTFSAVMLGKHIYGGLGQNLFNPAMVGYVILLISFPAQMTNWITPISLLHAAPSIGDSLSLITQGITLNGDSLHHLISGIDGITQATPLNTVKTGLQNGHFLDTIFTAPIFSHRYGSYWPTGWWQVNLAFLLGGLLLLWRKVIHWQIPTALLTTFALFCTADWLLSANYSPSPVWELLSGATMFCAFFIATDPVTASITPKGKIIFGALVGFLIYLIRYYAGYPDGVAFAILLANICVPFIDHYTKPRIYGH